MKGSNQIWNITQMDKRPAQENIESNHKHIKDVITKIIRLRCLGSTKKQNLKAEVCHRNI